MDPIIKPETIKVLGSTTKENTAEGFNEPKPKQGRWKKFKSWISEVCETFKPLVDMLLSVVSAATMLIKVCGRYQQCRRKEVKYA